MNEEALLFLVAGAFFLFMGVMGLIRKQVYLGRLIRFIGPKLVMKGKVSVLIYGILVSAAGVLVIAMGIAELTSGPDAALVGQIGPFAAYALLGGFIGSIVVEMIYFSSGWPPYDQEATYTHHEESYRDLTR